MTTNISLDSIHTRYGDFVEGELGKAIDSPIRNALVVRHWKELGENRQTIVFTVDINHAKHMAQMFQSCGVSADWVSGRDPDPRREQIIRDHKAGRLKVLCNCAVVSEGYDDPGIGCIVMARPTLSRLLFVQVIGRGLRLQEGIDNLVEARDQGVPIRKSNCRVIDVVDNTLKHDLVTTQSIFPDLQLRYGSSVLEVLAQSSFSKDDHRELPRIEPPDIDGIKTYAEEVDLFSGMKPRPFWLQGESGAEILPFKDGYVRIWQDLPDPKVEKLVKVGRRGPTSRAGFPSKPMTIALRTTRPKVGKRQKERCPYCKQRLFVDRLQRHMKTRCPKRPQ